MMNETTFGWRLSTIRECLMFIRKCVESELDEMAEQMIEITTL